MTASIAALESALATDSIEVWLAEIEGERVRARLRRVLESDRKLLAQYPDSVGSCMLARTFGDRTMAALYRRWAEELASRERPWIRPMRRLPLTEGLLAELTSSEVSLAGLAVPRFVTDDEIVVSARRMVPNPGAPERRKERVRWRWRGDQCVTEPDLDDEAAPAYPKFASDGWGPTYLIRSEGAPREALPCPAEGTASAKFTADGRRLLVYGSEDEYAAGFVYVVDPATLQIERALVTDSQVLEVAEGGGKIVVSTTGSGMIGWDGRRERVLPIFGWEMAVSPSGEFVATFAGAVKVWSLAALMRLKTPPPEQGFPPRFDPDGTRLVWDRDLLDGRTGELLARMEVEFGRYLEGGPADPWLYFGTRHMICTHGGLQLWDTRSGVALAMREPLGFSLGDRLAYDREGVRMAALAQGATTVALHELPHGRCVGTVQFEIRGWRVGMSADGGLIAVQDGGQVEVRTAEGALVRRCGELTDSDETTQAYLQPGPRFSRDGRRVAARVAAGDWRIWELASGEEERAGDSLERVAEFAAPWPAEWTVETSPVTVFTHVPSGARLALPAGGGWQANPGDPHIVVGPGMLAELRAAG